MRIALLLRSLPAGGVERVTLRLAQGFLERGHVVDLVLIAHAGVWRDRIPVGVNVFDLRGPESVIRAPWRFPAVASRYRSYVRTNAPDVVIAAKEQANALALCASIPVVATRHVPLDEASMNGALLYRWWTGRRARAVVAVSEALAGELRQIVPSQCTVAALPNAVLLVDPPEPGDSPFPPNAGADVLAVGRLSEQKGFDLLIEAFARVVQRRVARLSIVGDGPDRERLQRQIDGLGLRSHIRLVGQVARPRLWMRHADLFVLSSRWEGLPTVLIEALAEGTPVVATDCRTGPREILQSAPGSLVPVTVAALAQGIQEALDEDRPARVDVSRFTVSEATEAWLRLLGALSEGAPS